MGNTQVLPVICQFDQSIDTFIEGSGPQTVHTDGGKTGQK